MRKIKSFLNIKSWKHVTVEALNVMIPENEHNTLYKGTLTKRKLSSMACGRNNTETEIFDIAACYMNYTGVLFMP